MVENISEIVLLIRKVSGRVQEGPRSPPDPLKKYLISLKFSYFQTYSFMAYCIAYCISRPWVSCRGFLWNNLHCIGPIVRSCARHSTAHTALQVGQHAQHYRSDSTQVCASEKVCGLCFRESLRIGPMGNAKQITPKQQTNK